MRRDSRLYNADMIVVAFSSNLNLREKTSLYFVRTTEIIKKAAERISSVWQFVSFSFYFGVMKSIRSKCFLVPLPKQCSYPKDAFLLLVKNMCPSADPFCIIDAPFDFLANSKIRCSTGEYFVFIAFSPLIALQTFTGLL